MGPDHWIRVKEIFNEALERSSVAREAYVREACGADGDLLRDVLKLLNGQSRASETLSQPLFPFMTAEQPEQLPRFSPSTIVAKRFQIVRLIARGGMGEVYEAEDLQLGAHVALKTIRPDIAAYPSVLDQFKNEIQTARRVTHPNVCRIYDLAQHSEKAPDGSEEVTVFLTMELLEGETLSQHLETHGKLSSEDALLLLEQLASALNAAHKAGVVHRDFKPGNVMLAPGADGKLHATITDFGLALASAQVQSQALQPAGGGTPAYMAPEQVRGGEATPATDVFALGRVIAEIIGAQVQPAIPNGVTLAVPETFRRWEPILLRCLEDDPSSRYSSPIAVVQALTAASSPRFALIRTNKLLTVGLVVVLLGVTAFAAQRYRQWSMVDAPTYRKLGPDEGTVGIWRPSPDGRYFAITDWITGNLGLKSIATGEIRLLTNKAKSPDEAQALSAVFSPDGRQIAYTWLQNEEVELRIYDISAGTDSLLYKDPSLVYCDVADWSRDGSHVLAHFSWEDSDRIAVLSLSNHSVAYPLPPKSKFGDMVFAPDSAHVVYSAPQSGEGIESDIFEVSISGGPPVPLVTYPANEHIIGFSADGQRLVFTSDRKGTFGLWSYAFYGNTVEGQPTVLAADLGRASVIGMTQDGTFYYTVATNSRDVYTAEIDVASGRLLSDPKNVVDRYSGSFMYPSWSADGRELSFVSRLRRRTEIWVYSRQTGGIRNLEPNLASFQRPQWDPSGNRIFVDGRERGGRNGIFGVDANTGATEMVIDKRTLRGNEGTWARDGRTLFDRFSNAKLGIFRIDTQTGQRQVLYVPAGLDLGQENLALSPDESSLAFKARAKDASALMVIPATGGTARPLLTISDPESFPFGSFAWTADSTQILAVRTRDDSSELWLVPVNGENPRKVDFPPMKIAQLRMNADGRTIAFMSVEKESGEVWVAEHLLTR